MTYGGNNLNWPSTLMTAPRYRSARSTRRSTGTPQRATPTLTPRRRRSSPCTRTCSPVPRRPAGRAEREDPRADISAAVPAAAEVELGLRRLQRFWNSHPASSAHYCRGRGEALRHPGTAGEPGNRQRGEPGQRAVRPVVAQTTPPGFSWSMSPRRSGACPAHRQLRRPRPSRALDQRPECPAL